jgi:hypothetical protein
MPQIQLLDGKKIDFEKSITGFDLTKKISKSIEKIALIMEVDGDLKDLSHQITEDASVRIITPKDKEGLEVIRHDAAHIMAMAVQELFPGTQVTIGPVIENGFYYDFARKEPFTTDDLKKIEKKITFKISHKQKFIEYSPLSIEYLKIIARKINYNSGGILIIDYGYWNNNMKNTLKSISNHKFNEVLDNFGRSDITYNLSFKLVEKILKKFNLKIGGMTNQKNFLTNLGILKRAEIISKNLSFSKKADIYLRVKRLIDKNSMGELFKVMLATKKNVHFQTGFVN